MILKTPERTPDQALLSETDVHADDPRACDQRTDV